MAAILKIMVVKFSNFFLKLVDNIVIEYTKFEVDILNGFENKQIISAKYKMAAVRKTKVIWTL